MMFSWRRFWQCADPDHHSLSSLRTGYRTGFPSACILPQWAFHGTPNLLVVIPIVFEKVFQLLAVKGDDRFQLFIRPSIVNPTQHHGARQPMKYGSVIAYQSIHDRNAFFCMVSCDRRRTQDCRALLGIQIRQCLIQSFHKSILFPDFFTLPLRQDCWAAFESATFSRYPKASSFSRKMRLRPGVAHPRLSNGLLSEAYDTRCTLGCRPPGSVAFLHSPAFQCGRFAARDYCTIPPHIPLHSPHENPLLLDQQVRYFSF